MTTTVSIVKKLVLYTALLLVLLHFNSKGSVVAFDFPLTRASPLSPSATGSNHKETSLDRHCPVSSNADRAEYNKKKRSTTALNMAPPTTEGGSTKPWIPGDTEQAREAKEKLHVWPLDEHNAKLLNEVHPRGYVDQNAETKPHEVYDLIAIGSGAGGLVSSRQVGNRQQFNLHSPFFQRLCFLHVVLMCLTVCLSLRFAVWGVHCRLNSFLVLSTVAT